MWTVCRTHPNQEQIAIRNLINQEYNYYQPKILEHKLRRGKLTSIESPLFPCYLFVQVTSRWASINSTHGVSALLMQGGAPAVVNDKVIDGLRQREQNGFIQLPRKTRFMEGDKVTIQAGPFAGQQGLVARMSSKEREKVLLALLSNRIKVLVDETSLEAA